MAFVDDLRRTPSRVAAARPASRVASPPTMITVASPAIADELADGLTTVRHRQGRLLGQMEGLGFELRNNVHNANPLEFGRRRKAGTAVGGLLAASLLKSQPLGL